MSKRDDFQKSMEENLALWTARIETIKTKRRSATPSPADRELEEWQARSEGASRRLEVLKRTSGDDWDGLKVELVKAWEELDGFAGEAERALRADQVKASSSGPAIAAVASPAPAAAKPAV